MTKKSFNELFEDLIIKLELKDEKIYSHEYKFAIPTVFSKDELKTFSVKAVFIQNLWRSIFIAMIFLILLLLLNILKYLITPYKVDLLFLIGNSIPLFIILLIVFLILFFSELIRIFHIKRTIGKNFDEYDFYVSTCQNVLEHELVHIKLHKDFFRNRSCLG